MLFVLIVEDVKSFCLILWVNIIVFDENWFELVDGMGIKYSYFD